MAKYKVIKCELLKDRNEFNYLKFAQMLSLT